MTSKYIADLAVKAQACFDAGKDLSDTVAKEQTASLRAYMQMAQGNEVEGFSKFITSDVRDTVDWYQAQLTEIFVGGDDPVRFDPRSEEDVDQADLETKYVKHVIEEQNEGFLILSTWIKDALIQKNGILRCFWDDTVDEQPEEYKDKGFEDYAQLLEDREFIVEKVSITHELLEGSFTAEEFAEKLQGLPPELVQAGLQGAKFTVKGKRIRDLRQARIENVAPENFIIDSSHASLDLTNCAYCAERTYPTRAELVSDGHGYDTVMGLPRATRTGLLTETRYEKQSMVAKGVPDAGEQVEVVRHYIRDLDKKEPKLWCIETASNGSVIFDYYEVDRPPFHVITPKINPYRFHGDAVADEMVDIQYHRSNVMRAVFDNLKFNVVTRHFAKGDVDLEALNDHTPGAIITGGADGEVTPLTTPFVCDPAMALSADLSMQGAVRTGFSKDTAGLDPNALADSTNQVGMAILNLSQTRVKMVASIMANTGFKSLYEHIRELLYKYEDRDKVFAVTGKFMTVSPRKWFQSRSTSVKTGLGYAGKHEQIAAVNHILALQEKAVTAQASLNGPLVSIGNIHNALKRSIEVQGIKDVSTYFSDPAEYVAPPKEPTIPEKQIESYERTEMYKADIKAKTDLKKIETDAQLGIYEADKKAEVDREELIFKYREHLTGENDKKRPDQG